MTGDLGKISIASVTHVALRMMCEDVGFPTLKQVLKCLVMCEEYDALAQILKIRFTYSLARYVSFRDDKECYIGMIEKEITEE